MPASPTFSLCYLYVIAVEVMGDSSIHSQDLNRNQKRPRGGKWS